MATLNSAAFPQADRCMTSDADLLERTRDGDCDAYAELWERHSGAGLKTAGRISSRFDAHDLVSEAYARILQAIHRGHGPHDYFRSYLYVTIRNIAISWSHKPREYPSSEPSDFENALWPGIATACDTFEVDDSDLVSAAFQQLPYRWQQVLWYREVEGMRNTEIAPLLGVSPSAVAALTFRARGGLRRAWGNN